MDDYEKVVRGHEFPATNQTMELQALIGGLKALTKSCRVSFYSDAEYAVQGTMLWLKNWIKRGWRRSSNGEIANQVFWEQIARFTFLVPEFNYNEQTGRPYPKHDLTGNWIRGHVAKAKRSNHQEYNARCDEIAVEQAWICFQERRQTIPQGEQQ